MDSPGRAPKAVAFEVTLKKAEGKSPFKPIENKEPLSQTKIMEKLELADKRRLSVNTQKKEQAATELKRAQEKAQKVQEEIDMKRKKINDEMAADQQAKELKRKQIHEERKTRFHQRLASRTANMEEMNQVLINARKQLSERIDSELELADERRNKHLSGLLDRIKEHDIKIVEGRKNIEEAHAAYAEQLEEKLLEKIDNGEKNRKEQINQLIERLREHTIHVEKIRQNKRSSPVNDASGDLVM